MLDPTEYSSGSEAEPIEEHSKKSAGDRTGLLRIASWDILSKFRLASDKINCSTEHVRFFYRCFLGNSDRLPEVASKKHSPSIVYAN